MLSVPAIFKNHEKNSPAKKRKEKLGTHFESVDNTKFFWLSNFSGR
jgi:hypothetical protein